MSAYTYPDFQGMAEDYNRNGFVIVRNVLGADLLAELNRHIDWLMQRNPELEPERLGHWLIAHDPFWVRFLSDVHLLDVAEALIGSNIGLFAADYICKQPEKGKGVQWHQDGNYWPLDPMEVITIWFAVTESVRENGCVRMIPGSHQLGLQKHSSEKESENYILNQVDPSALNESNAVDIELAPGDISVHHPLLLHGSQPNTSKYWRRGGSIQYIPTTTRITRDWPCAFIFRGDAIEGINTYQPFPKYIKGEHMAFEGREAWS